MTPLAPKKNTMKKNVPIKRNLVPAKGHAPDIQRRINAGWLKLWRTVYPNTPPPITVQSLKSKVQRRASRVQGPAVRLPAAVQRLASFLSVWLALALLATGCAGPRPLKGGKAVTTHKPAGVVEQTLVQGENPSQASKQTQESVKVRTYTVPAGSRVEQSPMWEGERPREPKLLRSTAEIRTFEGSRPPGRQQLSTLNSQPPVHHSFSGGGSTLNSQPSTSFVISAPMPVVEREEPHARTELGAAQKDTARELGAKLSSLKGIVWVGVGLFVFGLASLVYPPLKVMVASVTTSAALMLGGLTLMVLPSLIVGNELLILGVVVLAVGGWFLAHRHGHLRGIVAANANALGGQASPRAQTSSPQNSQGSPSQDHS